MRATQNTIRECFFHCMDTCENSSWNLAKLWQPRPVKLNQISWIWNIALWKERSSRMGSQQLPVTKSQTDIPWPLIHQQATFPCFSRTSINTQKTLTALFNSLLMILFCVRLHPVMSLLFISENLLSLRLINECRWLWNLVTSSDWLVFVWVRTFRIIYWIMC